MKQYPSYHHCGRHQELVWESKEVLEEKQARVVQDKRLLMLVKGEVTPRELRAEWHRDGDDGHEQIARCWS